MGVPPIAVAVMAAVIIMAVVVIRAAVVMAPRKGSGKNPEKVSLQKRWGFPLGLLIRKGVQVGVIGVLINTSPA